MLFSLNNKRFFYVFFSFISLISSFSVIFFGIDKIENVTLYNTHLQSLAVISVAGLVDYFYINRLERAAVKHYKLISNALSKNLIFIVIPFVITVIFWGNLYAFFVSIILIKHFVNLRRSVELVNNRFNLSYLTYSGQVFRNVAVFLPLLDEETYILFFLCSFIPEVVYIIKSRIKGVNQNWKFSFKLNLLRADSFLYRFFYIASDFLVRVIFPFYLSIAEAANYLYIVNMILLPVAGYSLVGGIVHSYILRTQKLPEFRLIISLIAILYLFICLVYNLINLHEDIYFLMLLSFSAMLKCTDQVLISLNVSLGNFHKLKKVFLSGFIFSIVFFIVTIYLDLEPVMLIILSTCISSIFLMLSNLRRGSI